MESCDCGLDLILKDTGLGDSIDRMLRKWFTIKKPTRDFFFLINMKSNTLIYNIYRKSTRLNSSSDIHELGDFALMFCIFRAFI